MKLFLKAAILVCLYLCPLAVLSQEDSLFVKAEALRENRQFKKALPLYYQYLNKTEGNITVKQDASTAYKIAACYFNLSQYDSTIKYMKYALRQKERIMSPADTFIRSSHAVLGYIYRYEKSDIRKAAEQFDFERGIMGAFPASFSTKQIFQNYYNLASTNRILQDYERALNYAYQALEVAQTITQEPRLAENCYLVIANSLSGKKQYQQADEFYKKKLAINIDQRGIKHPSLALDYYGLAMNFNDRGLPEEAISSFLKAEQIALKHDRKLLSNIHRGLGVAYRLNGKMNLSVKYLYKAIDEAGSRPLNNAWAYRQIGTHYEIEKRYDSARHYYQKAFKALIPDYSWNSLDDNPSLNSLATSIPYIYTILELKANCSLKEYRDSRKTKSLHASKTAFDLLSELTDRYRDNLVLESSRLFFQQKNYTVYEKAIEVNFELHQLSPSQEYIENCWKSIEKNKSTLLLENLLKAEKEVGLKLPDSVRDKSREISQNLLKAQKDIRDCESSSSCNESQLISLRNEISVNENALRKHQSEIQNHFTDYYNFAENREVIQLADIKKSLIKDQSLINYFESEEYFYLITVNNADTELTRIAKGQRLQQVLSDFLKESSGETLQIGGIKKSFEKFSSTAHTLYKTLLPETVKTRDNKNLIIIPDGQLAGVPFEAMIKNMPKSDNQDFSQLDYLIRDFTINYGFSATLWFKNMTLDKPRNNGPLVAFGATSSPGRPELAKLTAVKGEMENLSALENTQIFSEEQATETNFKKAATKADVIHLALHNVNDYQNPLNSQLIFSDDNQSTDSGLYLYEIFNIPMTPSLVVLSGCETGVGKWLKGEGAYHMGRGFLYHGNPALVISLWKARDISTAQIMKNFYEEFNSNNSSESIRNAKLAFINTADPLIAHPSNWAAFISIGQTTMIQPNNQSWIKWVVISAVLLLIATKAVRKILSY